MRDVDSSPKKRAMSCEDMHDLHLMVFVTRSVFVRLRTDPQSGQNSKRDITNPSINAASIAHVRVWGSFADLSADANDA